MDCWGAGGQKDDWDEDFKPVGKIHFTYSCDCVLDLYWTIMVGRTIVGWGSMAVDSSQLDDNNFIAIDTISRTTEDKRTQTFS